MKNKVNLMGNLGNDPELRYTGNGTAVCNFRMATNEHFTDKAGNRQTRTEWHRITAWGKLTEIVGEHLNKGRLIDLEGRIQTRQWEDKDGVKRYTTEIVAQEILFLPSGAQEGERVRNDNKEQETRASGQEDFDYGPPPMADDDIPF